MIFYKLIKLNIKREIYLQYTHIQIRKEILEKEKIIYKEDLNVLPALK